MPIGVDVEVFIRMGPIANRTTSQRIMVRAVGPGDGVLDVITALPATPSAELVILNGTSAGDDIGRHHQSLLDATSGIGVRDRGRGVGRARNRPRQVRLTQGPSGSSAPQANDTTTGRTSA